MSVKRLFLEAAKLNKCDVDDCTDSITCTAPKGKVFSCSSIHELRVSKWDDETKADLWLDLLDRIEYGLHDCEEPNCEWCNDI